MNELKKSEIYKITYAIDRGKQGCYIDIAKLKIEDTIISNRGHELSFFFLHLKDYKYKIHHCL